MPRKIPKKVELGLKGTVDLILDEIQADLEEWGWDDSCEAVMCTIQKWRKKLGIKGRKLEMTNKEYAD